FEGEPLTGSISGWAEQIAREAEKEGRDMASSPEGEMQPKAAEGIAPEDVASKRSAAGNPPVRGEGKPARRIPERSSAPSKSARGTSMGGAASPKERAAAGLNPVAGLDIALEDAATLSASGVTATVAALSRLIETGDPNL